MQISFLYMPFIYTRVLHTLPTHTQISFRFSLYVLDNHASSISQLKGSAVKLMAQWRNCETVKLFWKHAENQQPIRQINGHNFLDHLDHILQYCALIT